MGMAMQVGISAMNIFQQALLSFFLTGSSVLVLAAPAPFPVEFDPATIDEDAGRKLMDTSDPLFADRGSVQAVGDTDGDGYDDYLFMVDTSGDRFSDTYYLIRGSISTDSLELSQLPPADGTALADAATFQGSDLGPAGDVNGDGLADWWAKQEGELGSELKLVFGREGGYPSPFLLGSTGVGESVRFMDSLEQGLLYPQIHPVGDFNGDGYDDLAFLSVDDGLSQSFWDLRIVYGAQGGLPAVVDVRELPASQITRLGVRFQDTLAGGGDVNGDGYDDIVAFRGSHVYIIYGAPDGLPASIDDSTRDGSRGFAILAGDVLLQGQVGIAGDMNGDALDDIYISSTHSNEVDGVYVIYGAASRQSPLLELEQLSLELGYKVTMESREGSDIVAGVGDINGDSIDDLLLGNNILYGSVIALNVGDVSRLNGVNGFRFTGGSLVWPAGDTNGDGLYDLIVNTPDSEISYLIFGRQVDDRLPASPGRVSASLGVNLIELRWDASVAERVVAYEIARDGDMLAQQDHRLTHYEDETAQRNVIYTYSVRAIEQEGRYSEPATIVVQNDKSLYPSIAGQVYSSSMAEIFWSYDNVQYNIYRDGELVDTRYASSYLDRNYSPEGHAYVVEVVGNATSPETVRSPTLRLPDDDGNPPPASTDSIDFSLYSASTLELFWIRVRDGVLPLSYEIRRDGELLGSTDGISFMDRNLPQSGSYELPDRIRVEYAIITIDAQGKHSRPSILEIDVTAALRSIRPAMASDLAFTFESESDGQLSWQNSDEGSLPAGYDIWLNDKRIGRTGDSAISVAGLAANTRYVFKVVAYGHDGSRSASANLVVVTPVRLPPLISPELRVAIYSSSTLELFWSREDSGFVDVESWQVYRDGVAVQELIATSWMDGSLEPGKSYEYQVKFILPGGDSYLSTTTRVTMPGGSTSVFDHHLVGPE